MFYVYSVLYCLVPRLLNKKKYLRFFIALLSCLVLTVVLLLLVQDAFTLIFENRHLYRKNIIPKFLSASVGMIVIISFFLAIYGLNEKYLNERKKEKIEREKLKAELQFLINQLNPHFLFNAINNICLLIREDKNLAEETLLKFSDLLRYQLYDCNAEKVVLSKELNFIRNFIALEKIRCNADVAIEFDLPETDTATLIAPYILLTFVENAFKHKSTGANPDFIKISSELVGNRLFFKVSNSTDVIPAPSKQEKGIGLQNVVRRLNLLYEGKHKLTNKKENNVYSVELELILD
jgi:LytS/YehU family sensor histidine kinase